MFKKDEYIELYKSELHQYLKDEVDTNEMPTIITNLDDIFEKYVQSEGVLESANIKYDVAMDEKYDL